MATKKSLFKRPAWAAKIVVPADDERSIFEQNVYEDILKENRRKEERRLARLKEKEQHRRKSASRDTQVDDEQQPTKKQRISADAITIGDEDAASDDWPLESGSASESEGRGSDDSPRVRRRKSSTPPVKHSLRGTPKKKKPEVRSMRRGDSKPGGPGAPAHDEDEDDELVVISATSAPPRSSAKSKPKPSAPPDSESDPDEDDYVKELKRAAREEAKRKQSNTAQQLNLRQSSERSPSNDPTNSTEPAHGSRLSATPVTAGPDPTDPEIKIRIITIIPNCDELYVTRRASQPLDMVLAAFTGHFHLTPQLTSKVFFTWNGKRLYKSTTMRSILAQVRAKYGTNRDGSDKANGHIEIEAVTEEIYQLRLKQRERERERRENGEDWTADAQETDETTLTTNNVIPEPAEQEPPKPAGTIIVLVGHNDQDLPRMNLRVHPHTSIQRIINGYKRKMEIDFARPLYLMFDGEVLENESTVADFDFQDEDLVHVGSR